MNGRSIRNSTVTAAFEAAYKNTVMVGKFPGGVLFIEINPERIDVNVHPSKIDVRFSDERSLFDAVYHAVKSELDSADSFKQAKITPVQNINPQVFQKKSVFEEPKKAEQIKNIFTVFDAITNGDVYHAEDEDSDGVKIEFPVSKKAENIAAVNKTDAENVAYSEPSNDFKILGEAFKTYIFLEMNGSIFVIDKHAAHERINFNKLKNTEQNLGSQFLLEPVSVTLGKDEYSAVLENIDTIKSAGFEIDDFGNGSVIVRSCPTPLDSEDVPSLISELAGYLLKNKKDISNEHLDWIYHNVACRSAIKAGDNSTPLELYELVKTVVNDDKVRFCPHGRPVMIEITRNELEKQFGRIQ